MSTNSLRSAPNIIFIMADDLGFNDVSWHNPDIYTPNLHNLGTIHIKFGLNYFDKELEPRNDLNKEMLYCRHIPKIVDFFITTLNIFLNSKVWSNPGAELCSTYLYT